MQKPTVPATPSDSVSKVRDKLQEATELLEIPRRPLEQPVQGTLLRINNVMLGAKSNTMKAQSKFESTSRADLALKQPQCVFTPLHLFIQKFQPAHSLYHQRAIPKALAASIQRKARLTHPARPKKEIRGAWDAPLKK